MQVKDGLEKRKFITIIRFNWLYLSISSMLSVQNQIQIEKHVL